MKFIVAKLLFVSLFFLSCSNKKGKVDPISSIQTDKTMDNFQFSFKSAHPKAQSLMTDSFYWSPIEEAAPFGNDDGFDAAYGFRDWRLTNKTASPVTYLNSLIKSWEYPHFDYNESDTSKIKEYITKQANLDEATIQQQIQQLKEAYKNSPAKKNELDDKQLREVIISSSHGMNGIYLLGQDNAIIAIGFAQFVLEGLMDADIRNLTITTLQRQLLPLLINRYDDSYREKRKLQLMQMLEVAKKAL